MNTRDILKSAMKKEHKVCCADCSIAEPLKAEHISLAGQPILCRCKYHQDLQLLSLKRICEHFNKKQK